MCQKDYHVWKDEQKALKRLKKAREGVKQANNRIVTRHFNISGISGIILGVIVLSIGLYFVLYQANIWVFSAAFASVSVLLFFKRKWVGLISYFAMFYVIAYSGNGGLAIAALIGLIALLIGYSIRRPPKLPCPFCDARGTIKSMGREAISEEKGFGLVERFDTVSGVTPSHITSGPDSTPHFAPAVNWEGSISRTERAPVIRTRYRYLYRCTRCGKQWDSYSTTETEDFSPREPMPSPPFSSQLPPKVTCQYCRSSVDATANKCPNCGAPIKAKE